LFSGFCGILLLLLLQRLGSDAAARLLVLVSIAVVARAQGCRGAVLRRVVFCRL
jgi:hypothetical protein